MNHSPLILASIDLKRLAAYLKLQISTDSPVLESLIMTASLMFVIGLAALWAVYHSKKKTRKRKHHSHHREQQVVKVNEAAAEEQKKLRKRRRRSEPPMNPTLAQTGGLPPLRDSNTSSFMP